MNKHWMQKMFLHQKRYEVYTLNEVFFIIFFSLRSTETVHFWF